MYICSHIPSAHLHIFSLPLSHGTTTDVEILSLCSGVLVLHWVVFRDPLYNANTVLIPRSRDGSHDGSGHVTGFTSLCSLIKHGRTYRCGTMLNVVCVVNCRVLNCRVVNCRVVNFRLPESTDWVGDNLPRAKNYVLYS